MKVIKKKENAGRTSQTRRRLSKTVWVPRAKNFVLRVSGFGKTATVPKRARFFDSPGLKVIKKKENAGRTSQTRMRLSRTVWLRAKNFVLRVSGFGKTATVQKRPRCFYSPGLKVIKKKENEGRTSQTGRRLSRTVWVLRALGFEVWVSGFGKTATAPKQARLFTIQG